MHLGTQDYKSRRGMLLLEACKAYLEGQGDLN